jgi:polycystin 2
MVRVTNNSCEVHPDFQNAITECYATYSSSVEDKNPFGNGARHYTSETA